jgi:hypothetical protein
LRHIAIGQTETAEARQIVDQFLAKGSESGGWLGPAQVSRILEGLRLPIPAWQITTSEETLLQAARRIGFPVVMKAIAPGLLHKSAVGGVILDIRNPDEARAAWHALASKISNFAGVLLQQYVPVGDEAIIGVKREPGFGHVIGLGAGGTRTERFQQMEFRLLPLTSRDCYSLIRDSAVAGICVGTSGDLASTGEAICEVLLRLSALVSDIPEINELDLNPVALGPAPRPVCILDARTHVCSQCE